MAKRAHWPCFAPDEIAAATTVLASGKVNYWTGGEGRAFEQEFAAAIGTGHAVALANGTVALEAALQALRIEAGDEVVLTPRTFMASASAIALQGAVPVFADVDPVSQNITAATIAPRLSGRTRAILCVHLAGWPCEMDAICALAQAHRLAVIEDCAQAHGARYHGRPVGAWGEIAAWSFCQDKIMTTGGEGGMITTDETALARHVWSLKDHGKSWEAVHAADHPPGFRWLHAGFGTNWRMTEMQAAIGRVQLRKLPAWSAARRRNAAIMNEGLAGIDGLRLTLPPAEVEHAYYKYYVFVRPERLASGWPRDRIMTEIAQRGVPCFSGSCPELYRERAFAGTGSHPGQALPVAALLGETSLMFLIDPTLDETACWRQVEVTRDVLRQAMR
ncbi:MAG: DegT/DnrJ/EryC1/StrS aminotransferase family protein [Geminicoccaceae bacterium]